MAVTDAYATAAEYRAAIGKTDTGADDEILSDLTAISRYLEHHLGRFFTKDAADVERIYLPPVTSDVLWVDDLSGDPTSIELDTAGDNTYADTLAATDYELLPLNADKGPEPRPFTRLRLTAWGDYSQFRAGQRVKITAQFGWPAVPEAVKRATIQLTPFWRLETPRSTMRIPELGETIEASPQVRSIIRQLTDDYRRFRYA